MEFYGLILILEKTTYGLPSTEVATEIPDSEIACYQMKAGSFKIKFAQYILVHRNIGGCSLLMVSLSQPNISVPLGTLRHSPAVRQLDVSIFAIKGKQYSFNEFA